MDALGVEFTRWSRGLTPVPHKVHVARRFGATFPGPDDPQSSDRGVLQHGCV